MKHSIEHIRNQYLLDKALKKAKAEMGIDFYKLIKGDAKENHRLNMKRHQDTLSLFEQKN